MSVSRETGVPKAAEIVFGPALEQARRYAEILATCGVERGLIGPREVDRLWDRHLLNCAVLEAGIARGSRVCDVGSGAGLPGIVVALVRPDLTMVLLEPQLRRWTFLGEVIDMLELTGRVSAVRERAEEHDEWYDVVTARALAPMDRLARWCLPLCRPRGVLLAMKGRRAAEELAAAERELRRQRARSWSIERYGEGLIGPPSTVIRVEAGGR